VDEYERSEADAIVFGEGVWFYKSGQAFRRDFRERATDEDPLLYILSMNPQTSLSLYPRGLLDSIGGFDEELRRYQDLDLNLRLCLAGGKHQYVPTDVTKIRMHGGGDRISNSSILETHPHHALKRLKKWTRLIEKHERMSSALRKELAQRAWSKGRAVLRTGQSEAADPYFDFARELHDVPLGDKSRPYRVIAKLLGPRIAEVIAKVARTAGVSVRNGEQNRFHRPVQSEEVLYEIPGAENVSRADG
jgi:GT2 family glycosyltransferase